MSYVVLARKWRPMSFDDLIGQSHVSRTLANAIQSGRVAHAFLFTGVRGVGKTTSARILAKALNCVGTPESPHSGPTITPCLECSVCREITAGTDLDVREIDGASYNGVDEVRKLQDSLPYRPARDRFKIFIVDEVHMLSQSAWNAFLKTLEEPPAHVKFIFATTEVQKVPITILSRVQRFDFKLIPTQLIVERLKHVLDAEKVASDDRALAIIAREAAGSMRDAMSLLDQVIAWNDKALDGDSVARVLGVASRQILHDVAAALVGGDAARCLEIVGQLANQGYDMATVTRDVLAVLRDLVVAKMCADPRDLLDLADEERQDVLRLAGSTNADDLIRLHQGFSEGFDDVVRSGQTRAGLEMLLVRLARRPPLIPMDDLIARLGAMEKRLGGAPRGGPPPSPGGPGGGVSPARTETRPAAPPPGRTEGRTPAKAVPEAPSLATTASGEGPPNASARAPEEGAKIAGPAGGSATPADDATTLGSFRAIVERVRATRPELAALLHHASVVQVDRDRVTLAFEPGSVFEQNARAPEAVELLRQAALAHFGSQPVLSFESAGSKSPGATVAAAESRERSERQREALARAKQHPKIAEVTQILGARLKEIRLPDE
jgi:DNA polymerase-3 subunit gamma/tau